MPELVATRPVPATEVLADGEQAGGLLLGHAAAVAAASRPNPVTQATYQAVYAQLLGWLAAQLGRAPRETDLTEPWLLAWRLDRQARGGRGGDGIAPATLRKELAAVRVLARTAGHPELAVELRMPTHEPPPPATLSVEEYERLLRMPNRATRLDARDAAILHMLGDTGLRNSELRALRGRDLIRVRRDSPTRSLRVHGKGGRGRVLRLTRAADAALGRWLDRHPAGRPLPAHAPLFVTLGRGGRDVGRPLSLSALEDLVAVHMRHAGITPHLRHPHALRAYALTRLVQLGIPVHRVRDRAGHRSLNTTGRYLNSQELHQTGENLQVAC